MIYYFICMALTTSVFNIHSLSQKVKLGHDCFITQLINNVNLKIRFKVGIAENICRTVEFCGYVTGNYFNSCYLSAFCGFASLPKCNCKLTFCEHMPSVILGHFMRAVGLIC